MLKLAFWKYSIAFKVLELLQAKMLLMEHKTHGYVPYASLFRRKVKLCLIGAIVTFAFVNSFVGIFVQYGESNCVLRIASFRVKDSDHSTSTYSVNHRLPADVDRYTSQLISGMEPDVRPINLYDLPYVISNRDKCRNSNGCLYDITLLLIVKSAAPNFEKRNAVRKTWGWEQRFPNVVVRTVFNLGVASSDTTVQEMIQQEQRKHGDIIQGGFTDAYFNNTIKTMMGFRWVVENCPTAKFVMFVDDDMFVSTKNALRFASRPDGYPTYDKSSYAEVKMQMEQKESLEFDLNDPPATFFAGNVKRNYRVQRNITCKLYVPYSEYPFNEYPPFVPAGAYMLSFKTLRKMYYTSMYTPHFRLDDVYLSMVAKTAGIELTHNDNFVINSEFTGYKHIIANHGFNTTAKLLKTWEEQHTLDYA